MDRETIVAGAEKVQFCFSVHTPVHSTECRNVHTRGHDHKKSIRLLLRHSGDNMIIPFSVDSRVIIVLNGRVFADT